MSVLLGLLDKAYLCPCVLPEYGHIVCETYKILEFYNPYNLDYRPIDNIQIKFNNNTNTP